MSTAVVRIEGLTKRLRRGVLAVDGLDLVVEQGQVVGLTGPNGSGKSVTLRMLLGLVRPSAGRVWLFGEPVRPGAAVLGRVGALVDGPGIVPHLSGYENLGTTVVTYDGVRLLVEGSAIRPLDLFTALDRAGVEVRGFHKGRTLEAAYVALVNGAKNGHASPDPTPTIP